MELIEVIGVDPSVRFTGVGKVSFNTETNVFKVDACAVIENKNNIRGTAKIKEMICRIEELASEGEYGDAKDVVVESPVMPFFAKFQGSTMITVGHIAGASAALFGIDRCRLYRPGEWNRSKKKEVTHARTQEILGPWESWGWKKSVRRMDQVEHVLDAVSMALWYLQETYLEEE